MTQVSSDLEIVAVRASMEADFEVDPIGRDATTIFNRLRDRTSYFDVAVFAVVYVLALCLV